MRNTILILLSIILCANECNSPYNAKTIFKASDPASRRYLLDNHLELTFRYTDLDWRRLKKDTFLFICNQHARRDSLLKFVVDDTRVKRSVAGK